MDTLSPMLPPEFPSVAELSISFQNERPLCKEYSNICNQFFLLNQKIFKKMKKLDQIQVKKDFPISKLFVRPLMWKFCGYLLTTS